MYCCFSLYYSENLSPASGMSHFLFYFFGMQHQSVRSAMWPGPEHESGFQERKRESWQKALNPTNHIFFQSLHRKLLSAAGAEEVNNSREANQ